MKKKVNSKLIVSIVLAVILVIAVTAGISYAFFYYSKIGTKTLSFETGSISLQLGEIGEGISLTDQFPIDDEKGMTLTDTYTFTITGYNTGTLPIYYDISAVLGNEVAGKTRFDDDEIKIYITDELGNPIFEAGSPTGLKENGESLLITDIIPGNTPKATPIIKTYVLRIWITSDKVWISETDHPEGKNTYTMSEFGNRYFSMKIKVKGDLNPRFASRDILTTINNDLAANLYTPAGDNDQTFIVGTASDANYKPNNYLWYSGKLWRMVALNKTDGVVTSIKLITQDLLTTTYWDGPLADGGNGEAGFENSFMYQWLNEDFYDTLRNPTNYLVTDYVWNATTIANNTKPPTTTMVTSPVGTVNSYEYYNSYTNTTAANGYLNIGYQWFLLNGNRREVIDTGGLTVPTNVTAGIRPAINIKSNVEVVAGNGTLSNPYRLAGDNDKETDLINNNINTRYSGEYVKFNGEDYRIVTTENELTKLVKVDYIRSNGTPVTKPFGTTKFYSQSLLDGVDYWGGYLNIDTEGTWYNSLSSNSKNMLATATWYSGIISTAKSYKLGICATVETVASGGTRTSNCPRTTSVAEAKVGMLRHGEIFSAQTGINSVNVVGMTILTPAPSNFGDTYISYIGKLNSVSVGSSTDNPFTTRPALYLKSAVYITGGDGTPQKPFTIAI